MLADPRPNALVENFAGQWLQLRNLQGIVPNPDTFPDFDDNLRQAFRREAELFFASVVREDRNVLDLMTADYTFVNERLASTTACRRVRQRFRRVTLTDDARRDCSARRRAARHLARDDDVSGPAGQVGAREPAGPPPPRRRPTCRRCGKTSPGRRAARCASRWSSTGTTRLRVVPQDDGSRSASRSRTST
jgi:hypothetical protein